MKNTRALLIDLARREAERRGADDDVISGYIVGSVARDEEPLGGVTDIDLVLIHDEPPNIPREIVRLSDQIHHDIAHHHKDLYSKPRELRVHPWMGPALCEPLFIYDPHHFFEWAQAGARGQFYRPDHVLTRSKAFLQQARRGATLLPMTGRWVRTYVHAAMDAVNAVACLTGFPAAGRRVMAELADSIAKLEYPQLLGGFLDLVGAEHFNNWDVPALLSAWGKAFDAATDLSNDPELHPSRRIYFLQGFQTLVEDDQSKSILWTLLSSWERSIFALDSNEEWHDLTDQWDSFLRSINLSTNHRRQREEQLAAYIDSVENIVETWGEEHGA
jgi:hypothetical protein